MEKTYKVIESTALSNFYDKRYVVVDIATGEILDDAQGYGYKSIKNAYSAYAYKNRDKSKDKEKAAKKKLIHKWMKKHKSFVDSISDDVFYSFKDGEPIKVNTAYIKNKLKECNLELGDFKPTELIKELGYK